MPDTLDKIQEKLLKKWQEHADKIGHEELSNRINQLLIKASKNKSLFKVIIVLLNNFQYYSKSSVNTYLTQLYKKLLDAKVRPYEDIMHTFIQSNGEKINSSIEYFIEYKKLNNIDKLECSNDLKLIRKETWPKITQIAIVDDCCGSGKSLEKFIKGTGLKFDNKILYYIVIHMMSDAKQKLKDIEKDSKNFQIIPISIMESEKVFNKKYLYKLKSEFIDFSKEQKITDDFILGFEKTEALFAFYNNTPNNTLGLFWKNTNENNAIFPREFGKTPSWSLKKIKEEKSRRSAQLYNRKLN
jgi:hypothetical protein